MIASKLPILLTVLPLLGAAMCPIVGMWSRKWSRGVALFTVAATTAIAFLLIGSVSPGAALSYHVAGWAPPWGIEVRLDFLGLYLTCTISSIGLMILIYSWRYIEHALDEERIPYYYALYLLSLSAMLGCSSAGDLFNLFVFMEIFSVTCYALVALTGEGRALRASFKYLLVGAVSSVCVLMAIAFLYGSVGSLNLIDIGARLAGTPHVSAAGVALVLFLVGFAVKAALFPVHVWLPDAHSLAPSPISAMLSALVIKMGVLGIFRVLFTMYGQGFEENSLVWSGAAELLAWAAAMAIVAGAAMAIIQTDLKLLIAYSSVVHIGYILLGLFLLNSRAMTGGLYNILAHGMAKACLFLAAGSLLYKHGVRDIRQLKGLGARMPLTAGAFTIASLSIVGLPPSAGFMAKWHILWGAVERGRYAFLAMALAGTLLSAAYLFRVVYILFFMGPPGPRPPRDEVPATMWAPTLILALGTLFFGVFATLLTPSLHEVARQLPLQ